MRKFHVIKTIRNVGEYFGNLMGELCGPDYLSGYMRAVDDMVRVFSLAKSDEEVDDDMMAMRHMIAKLREEIGHLERQIDEKEKTMDKLLRHVDIFDFIGDCHCTKRG